MGYARHIGRIGALAVALGVGAAAATTAPGMAYAQPSDSGSSSSSTDTASSTDASSPGGTSPAIDSTPAATDSASPVAKDDTAPSGSAAQTHVTGIPADADSDEEDISIGVSEEEEHPASSVRTGGSSAIDVSSVGGHASSADNEVMSRERGRSSAPVAHGTDIGTGPPSPAGGSVERSGPSAGQRLNLPI